MSNEKKKIAVLGAGPASLAAVYELTSYAGWEQHYDITVYQMGWRLGGKVATGRGPKQRIEEHGIHIAQGWYNNTFRIIQDAYEECRKNGLTPNSPFQTWEEAFVRENTTLLTHFDARKGKWLRRNINFPTNQAIPGQGDAVPVSQLIKEAIEIILGLLIGSETEKGIGSFIDKDVAEAHAVKPESWIASVVDKVKEKHKDTPTHLVEVKYLHHILELLEKLMVDELERPTVIKTIVGLLELVQKGLAFFFEGMATKDEKIYWIFVMMEFGLSNIRGLLADVYDPQTHSLDFTRINHLDYRAWLKNNGAGELTLDSAATRFIYTGTFHNLSGQNRQGYIAAGVATNFLTSAIGYKGSFVWKFKGGTADTMVTPIYKVLQHRGVSFKFFHKTEQVHYSDSGNIEKITIAEQVSLKGEKYNPIYSLKGLDVWPARPLYDQLNEEQARALRENDIDLEMAWSPWQNIATHTLKKGEHFDEVILGIPIEVLRGEEGICRELIENNARWQQMAHYVKTTPTMAMQLWLKPTLEELGMDLRAWNIINGKPNLVVYANPMYSWVDQSLVLPYEDWGDQTPGLLIYYTGTMVVPNEIPPFTDHHYPTEQVNRVIYLSEQWLKDNMGWFFPKATTPEYPAGMRLDIIIDPEGKANSDDALLRSQHFRANVNPTDRYTLSLPGTNLYRLKPGESGFNNLFLAGDWTDFGVNVGYYEGAIISGLKAAQALRKKLTLTADNPVFGELKM